MNTRQKRRKRMIWLFTQLLQFGGWFAKRPFLTPVSKRFLRLFADLTIAFRHGRRQDAVKEIAREWQRMFPSKAFVPIRETRDETVYAAILGECPVTGTGDVHACYRLMEYDRRLLEHLGGEFVVLESKADPAVPVCRVAMRRRGAAMDDLLPAHERNTTAAENN